MNILLLNIPIGSDNATAVTMNHLFSAIPSENLFFLGEQNVLEGSVRSYKSTYVLGRMEKSFFSFRSFFKDFVIGKDGRFGWKISIDLRNNRIGYGVKISDVYQLFGLKTLFFRLKMSSDLAEWFEINEIDAVYSIGSDYHTLDFLKRINNKFNRIKVFYHVMDDWPMTIRNSYLIKGDYLARKTLLLFKEVISLSTKRFAISEKMAVEYNLRYGYTWKVFHNPVDTGFWRQPNVNEKAGPSSEFQVLYAGRLSKGVSEALRFFADVIEEVNANHETQFALNIISKEPPKWLSKGVKFKSYGPYTELPKVFASADLLLIPYDFSGEGYKFIKYSMPTKLTEYCASGTPVMIFAPAETALVEYAEKHKLAFMVNHFSKSKLAESLIEIVGHYQKHLSLAKSAQEYVSRVHDISIVSAKFNVELTL